MTAKHVLAEVLRRAGVRRPHDAMGRAKFLGEGLSYRVYWADCEMPDGAGTRALVVRIPRADADADQPERAMREATLIEHLQQLDLPMRLPRLVAAIPVETGIALVQEAVTGVPLTQWMRRPSTPWWEMIAEAAAICARVDVTNLPVLPSSPTRREHAEAALAELDDLAIPEVRDAHAWAMSHLPPSMPSCLVHGDLLPQNLIQELEPAEPLGVIDWDQARIGDPAYDLAIVTRGSAKPFKTTGALPLLVEAYNQRAPYPLRVTDVRVYELCLVAGFYRQHCRAYGEGSPHAENTRRKLASILRRADAG